MGAENRNVEVLVLGAGPCGLGAARQLERNGVDSWLLLDRSDEPGGLAASFVDEQGFTWDIGGHVQFSHYEYFDQAMDDLLGADGWNEHRRESWIWMGDRFVPYPFQNNLHRLDPVARDYCVAGLREASTRRAGAAAPGASINFLQWIRDGFGRGIAELFMEPYNAKVWAYPLEMMGITWMGERVSPPDLERVLATIESGVDDVSWGPNNTFRFPVRGGTGAIWSACADRLPAERLALGEAVVELDLSARRCRTSNGRQVNYQHLISTVPLDVLLSVAGLTEFDHVARAGLLYSSSNIVGIGINGEPPEDLREKSWMYFPDSEVPFYRATVFSNYAAENVPRPGEMWSLMFEVSESPYRPVDQRSLVGEVLAGAARIGLVADPSSVVSTWQYRAHHGYPTPGLGRDIALGKILPHLEQYEVLSRGRFGMWRYEVSNQDHAFMQGVEAVERIVNGRQELTAFDPGYANSCKHPWPFSRWEP